MKQIDLAELLTLAAHEVRTPLGAMRGRIDVALRRKRDVTQHEAILHAIHEDLAVLSATVNALLAVARPVPPGPPTLVRDLLVVSARRADALLLAGGGRVTWTLEEDVVVSGHPAQLGMAIGLALVEVIRIGAGLPITVTVRSDKGWAVVGFSMGGTPTDRPSNLELIDLLATTNGGRVVVPDAGEAEVLRLVLVDGTPRPDLTVVA